MNKKLIKALILASLLSLSTTAFAANPFELVPKSNWTYTAINNLVQAGVFEGYTDVNFSRDRQFTRYELATFVGKAMANQDKANTDQKEIINKLAVEFKGELTNLGVYTAATTPTVAPVAPAPILDRLKITGDMRTRYEYTKSDDRSDDITFRTRLNIDFYMNDTWKLHTRTITTDHATSYKGAEDGTGTSATLADQVYVSGPVGSANLTLGKMPLTLGKGLLMDTDWGFDGAKVDFGNQVKAQVGYMRAADRKKYFFADTTTNLTKNLDVTAAYLKDADYKNADSSLDLDAQYNAWAVGLGYKGLKNLAVTGEYGKNSVSDAKAWIVGVTFRDANYQKVKSWDTYAQYRKAAPKFDPEYWSTPDDTYAVGSHALDDIEGIEYGFDYIPMKNAKLHFAYGDMKNYAGTSDNDRSYFISSLNFKF